MKERTNECVLCKYTLVFCVNGGGGGRKNMFRTFSNLRLYTLENFQRHRSIENRTLKRIIIKKCIV